MSRTIVKQGIISILGSECEQTKAASLRRTLSADMSSRTWSVREGFSFSPMKRIASSGELAIRGEDSSYKEENEEKGYEEEETDRPGQDDIWRMIQSQKKEEVEKPARLDTWAEILSQKVKEGDKPSLPPPYVHPLVKRSSSSLSKKSLEICTESLGSETGSDRLSSYASSEIGDADEEKDETQPQPLPPPHPQPPAEEECLDVYSYSATKKSQPKCFPPPLPSLAQRGGPSLHMQPRRQDGRLVLEAVSLPSKNCFRARRQDGRLLLTFANNTPTEDLELEETNDPEEEIGDMEEEVFNAFEDEEEEVDEAEKGVEVEEEDEEYESVEKIVEKIGIDYGAGEIGVVIEQEPRLSGGVTDVHRSTLVMKKLTGLNNRDPTWCRKFKRAVNLAEMEGEMEEDQEGLTPLSQSLPRPSRQLSSPPVATVATSFNVYEYFWQVKQPALASVTNPITQPYAPLGRNSHNVTSPDANQKQEMVLLRGHEAEYLVPMIRGCKENKRSLLIWEPYCIATS